MVITGGCGDLECWHNSQTGTVNCEETCPTVYIVKLLDSVLRLEGNSLYGDMMERTIFNALFSTQSPDGRKIRYFTPFDGPRVYCWTGDTYCCPNQYRRGISQLPEWIYYRTRDGAAVNLYTASSARLELNKGAQLSIAKETDYPNSGNVTLRIDPDKAGEFSVSLRIRGGAQIPRSASMEKQSATPSRAERSSPYAERGSRATASSFPCPCRGGL